MSTFTSFSVKKLFRIALSLALLFPGVALAQNSAYPTLTGAGSPVGVITCGPLNQGQTYTDNTTGLIWTCTGTSWKLPAQIVLASAFTNSTTSFLSVPGMVLPVAANANYFYICHFVYQTTATTAAQVRFTGPASPTALFYTANFQMNVGTSTAYQAPAAVTTFSTPLSTNGALVATTNMTIDMVMHLINGANAGNVQLQIAAQITGSMTLQPGSACAPQ